jgi:VCBS repeat-containing protein
VATSRLRHWFNRRGSKPASRKLPRRRLRALENLEARIVLASAPIAQDDSGFVTFENTPLTVTPFNRTYNAGADLLANEVANAPTETQNPNFTVPEWSYGLRNTTLGPNLSLLTLHTNNDAPSGNFDGWRDPAGQCCGTLPYLAVNKGPAVGDPQGSVATGEILMHPDGEGPQEKVVARFTASIAGMYNIVNAVWEDLNNCCGGGGGGVDVHVVRNAGGISTSLFDSAVSIEGDNALPDSVTFNGTTFLNVGDSLDFVVGTNGQLFGDSTRFNVTLQVQAGLFVDNGSGPDFDPDNDPISVSSFTATSANGATVSVTPSGGFTYDPSTSPAAQALMQGQSLTDTFTYTITDGNSGFDTATVSVVVNGVNDAVNDTFTVTEDVPASPGNVLSNDQPAGVEVASARGQSVTGSPNTPNDGSVTVTTVQGGTVVIQDNGNFTYNQNGAFNSLSAGQTGTDSFVYTVAGRTYDAGNDLVANEVPNGSETNQNVAGVWSYGERPTATGTAFTLAPNHTDSYAPSNPNSLQGWVGSQLGNTVPLLLVNTSAAPIVAPELGGPGGPIPAGSMIVHPADISAANPYGVVRWTAPVSGTYDLFASWRDISNGNTGASSGADVHVIVNGVSIFDAVTSIETNPADPTVSTTQVVTLTAGSTVDFVIGPNSGSYGSDSAVFDATLTLQPSQATVTLKVAGRNDPFTAVNDPTTQPAASYQTNEDTPLNTSAANGVLANDTDADAGDTHTVTSYTPTSAKGATVVVDPNGSFSYDPTGSAQLQMLAAGQTTTDTFTYAVAGPTYSAAADLVANELATGTEANPNPVDDGVWSYGGRSTFTGTTLSLATVHTNVYAPAGSPDPALQGWLGNGITTDYPFVLVNVTNAPIFDAPNLGAPGGPIPAGGMIVHPANTDAPNQFGIVRWTAPVAGTYNLAASWTDISNGGGGGAGADVHVVVNGVSIFNGITSMENGPAVASTSQVITVAAGDTVDFVIGNNGFYGNDTAVFDATLTLQPSQATVTITVVGTNDPVNAVDDPTTQPAAVYTTNESTPITVSAANGVLVNDTDPDTGTTLVVTNTAPFLSAKGAAVTINANGGFTYDPSASAVLNALAINTSTTDTFTYTASDGQGSTDTATVTITVNGQNDAPTVTANNASVTVNEGQTATNSGTFSDVDAGDIVTITGTINNVPTPVSQLGSQSGTWTWNPPASRGDETGPMTVIIKATDSSGASSTTSFTYVVNNVAPTPVENDVLVNGGPATLNNDNAVTIVPGMTVTYVLSATDPALDSVDGPFTFVVDFDDGSAPVTGTTTNEGDQISFSHVYTTTGNFQPTVTVTDSDNGESDPLDLTPVSSGVQAVIDGTLYVGGTINGDRIVVIGSSNGGFRIRFNNMLLPQMDADAVVVNGNRGNDVISVTGKLVIPVTFYGDAGDDYLAGSGSGDTLDGGAGRDRLLGGGGNDTLLGGAGNDTLSGGAGLDYLSGDEFVDQVGGTPDPDGGPDSLPGDVLVSPTPGNDSLNGDNGDDIVVGGGGNDVLYGGLGNDFLLGGLGSDRLDGGNGSDLLVGDGGNDTLYGRQGRDVLIGGNNLDSLMGGLDDDLLYAGDLVDGTDDTMLMSVWMTWMSGDDEGGADELQALAEDDEDGDLLHGESGADYYLQQVKDVFRLQSEKKDPSTTIREI